MVLLCSRFATSRRVLPCAKPELVVAASSTTATAITSTAAVIRAIAAVVIPRRIVSAISAGCSAVVVAWWIIRAVAAAAMIVTWLGFARGHAAQPSQAHAGSEQGRQAQSCLSPCQRACCFLVHRTPACLHRCPPVRLTTLGQPPP